MGTPEDTPLALTIADVYGTADGDDALEALLDASLDPRSPELLFTLAAELGLDPTKQVLDVGCRDGRHAIELVERFGCHVVGVEPVDVPRARARAAFAASPHASRLDIRDGRIEALPCDDRAFDLVWCRDMLVHVPDLARAFVECARVLRPGGVMLVFQTFATELLEPREAARLYGPLAIVADSMDPANVEAAARAAGLDLERTDVIASEWREHGEEQGARRTSKQLLRIARMRRARDTLVAKIGLVEYETELADATWGVYQMLGKLCPRIYVLRRGA